MRSQANKQQQPPTGCGFCKRNKEPEHIFRGHQLKDSEGKVTCPQLFRYRCELCGSTGEEAHTRSYCPQLVGLKAARKNSSNSMGNSQEATQLGDNRVLRNMGRVTNSRYNSAGRLRYPPRNQQNQQQQHRRIQQQPLYDSSSVVAQTSERLEQGLSPEGNNRQFWSWQDQ